MKKHSKYILSIASGLLLAAAWPAHGFPFLLLVGFIPLLYIEDEQFKNRDKNHSSGIFAYVFIAFFVWNALTCWWIYNAAFVGVAAAVLVNSTLTSLAFWLFHIMHRKFPSNKFVHFALIAFWISYEFLHSRWDLNWPHMNLGHGFGAYPKFIQWYEYTGFFGGTLWILGLNILIFKIVQYLFILKENLKLHKWLAVFTSALLIIPIAISLIIYYSYKEKNNPINIVVVQPNLDPYSEQYRLEPTVVAKKMMNMALSKADSSTKLILFPESALQESIWENQFNLSPSISQVREYLQKLPDAQVISGMSSFKQFEKEEKLSCTARRFNDSEGYYDAYNTALLISKDSAYQKYHKTRLVAGIEQMPYAKYLKFLEKYAIDMGGTVGSLGKDSIPAMFILKNGTKIAPVICFESSFGEYVTKFIRRGSQAIIVITNEGWWGDTPGYRQFLYNTAIRAIETRRSIARSANTGVSCFINQRGEVQQPTKYWTEDVIKQNINLNDKMTFYVKHGDYIGRFFLMLSGVFLLFAIYSCFKKNKD